MWKVRGAGVVVLSLFTVSATVFGLTEAVHSSLFIVQVVEVETDAGGTTADRADPPAYEADELPLTAQAVSELAAIPVGKANLFSLSLDDVESRILTHPWVRSVRLEKRFPQTLAISVSFRKPVALLQGASGSLSYVDQDARPFGKVNLSFHPDLPLISSPPNLPEALDLVRRWEAAPLGRVAQLSSLAWEPDRGYHAVAVYRLGARTTGGALGRTSVELGPESQGSDGAQLARLAEVFRYLQDNSLPARQIWADAGKKIVVKTARGS